MLRRLVQPGRARRERGRVPAVHGGLGVLVVRDGHRARARVRGGPLVPARDAAPEPAPLPGGHVHEREPHDSVRGLRRVPRARGVPQWDGRHVRAAAVRVRPWPLLSAGDAVQLAVPVRAGDLRPVGLAGVGRRVHAVPEREILLGWERDGVGSLRRRPLLPRRNVGCGAVQVPRWDLHGPFYHPAVLHMFRVSPSSFPLCAVRLFFSLLVLRHFDDKMDAHHCLSTLPFLRTEPFPPLAYFCVVTKTV